MRCSILLQRTTDEGIKRYALQIMRRTGSLVYTRRVLSQLRDQIAAHLEALGGHALLSGLMRKLDGPLDALL